MAAEGTRLGTGYVSIEPDFSRFQELLGKRLSKAFGDAKLGDRLGRELAQGLSDQVGLRLRRATKGTRGDMFGLADAIGRVERESRKAGRASKGLERDIFGVNRAAKDSGRSLRSARTQLRDWHMASQGAADASRRLSDRLRSLGSQLRSVGRDGDGSRRAFTSLGGGMSRINRTFTFFRNILRTLKWPLLIASVGLAAQGLSALAAGAVAATSSLGPLAGSLIVLPAAALAAAQAISTLKLATAGVGDAIKASLDAQIQGGEQAVDTMRRQEDAAERVADAKRNLASVQRQALFAQEDLNEARREAVRELEDMREAANRSHESEEQAALSLRQARAELNRTLNDVDATGLDIRLAEADVDRAQADLQRTRTDAKRARQDYRDAQKSGVEGMPQVVAAKRAEEDATRAVQDAQRDLARATRDSTAAMEEQGSAATALQQKMAQLPPAAREFVREIVGLKPKLDVLRETAASGFFPGATRGLHAVLKNFGPVKAIVGETARAFGNLAERAGKQFGSARWGRDLRKLGKGNTRLLNRMGEAGMNLADALRHIMVAAQPFLDWLGESTVDLSEWVKGEAKAGRETGRLADFFDRVREAMELTGPILKGVGGALLNIGEAARPVGNEILASLGDAAEGWRDWTDSTEGQNNLRRYFRESKPAIDEMGRLIRDVGKAFFELGRQSGVAELLRLVRTELVPAMTDLFGASTGFAADFLEDLGKLRKDGVPTFEAFVRVLAEHAGEAGFKIARALVLGFINAGIWGKVAIGGFILSKFGALSAFGKWGAQAGGRLGKHLFKEAAKWIAGTQAGSSLLGWFQGTFGKGGRFTTAARTGGMRVGRALGRGVAFGAIAGLIAIAPLLREAADKFIIGPIQQAMEDTFGSKIGGALRKGAELIDPANLGPVPTALGLDAKGFVRDKWEDILGLNEAKESGRRLNRIVRQEAKRTREGFSQHIDLLPGIAERSGRGVNVQMLPRLDHLADEGGTKGRKFANRLGGAFTSVAGAAGNAMGNINDNIREALKALNVGKVPKFRLKKLVQQLPELAPMGRQRGGPINIGAPSGDSVPAMLERGEYVLNRKAVKRVGKSKLDAINFGMAPRFQKGGFAELQPPARALAQELAAQGFVPTSTYRPASTTYHGRGEAIDYGDSVNSMGRLWAVLRPKVARLAELFGPSRLPGATLWKHGSPFSDAGLQADHEDHIHTAITGMVGAIGRALSKVPRMMLQGPDGPLKNLGQAAIDKVRRAANSFISEKTAASGMGHGAGQAAGSAQLRDWLTTALKLTGHFSPANLTALTGRALQESGGNPRAINLWDSNAAAGIPSKGLLQTIDPTFNAYKMKGLGDIWNPVHNAVAAIRYMMDRYGHIVGPSGTGYVTGGLVEALQLGGMAGFQAGGQAGKGKSGKRKYAPMQRHLERLKSYGLDDETLAQFTGTKGRLTAFSEEAERYSEWASNASALTVEGASGETIQGVFQGGTEGDWLLKQIQSLGSLRNQLIAAQEMFAKIRERVQKMLDRAKRQIAKLAAQIRQAQGRRQRLVNSLRAARQALSDARSDSNPERRARRIGQAQETIAGLEERIRQVDFRQSQRTQLRTHLSEKIMPQLEGRFQGVSDVLSATKDGGEGFIGLDQVQGKGGPMNPIASYGADSPPLGTLGGEILGVQARLRAIGEERNANAEGEGDSSERESLLEEIARKARIGEALANANLITLGDFDAMKAGLPTFHTGGVVPGPRGVERLVNVRAGEGVFTPEQMAAMGDAGGSAGGLTIESIVIHEDDRATVRFEGQEFEAAVQRVVKSTPGTGRVTPGGARY